MKMEENMKALILLGLKYKDESKEYSQNQVNNNLDQIKENLRLQNEVKVLKNLFKLQQKKLKELYRELDKCDTPVKDEYAESCVKRYNEVVLSLKDNVESVLRGRISICEFIKNLTELSYEHR